MIFYGLKCHVWRLVRIGFAEAYQWQCLLCGCVEMSFSEPPYGAAATEGK